VKAYSPRFMLPYRQGFMHGFADRMMQDQELDYSQIIAEAYEAIGQAHDGLSVEELGDLVLPDGFWAVKKRGLAPKTALKGTQKHALVCPLANPGYGEDKTAILSWDWQHRT
jgi:hypothetical protein